MMKKIFYPSLNEIYKDYLVIDECIPEMLKKEYINIVRIISRNLYNEGFSEQEIEYYLTDLLEDAI